MILARCRVAVSSRDEGFVEGRPFWITSNSALRRCQECEELERILN